MPYPCADAKFHYEGKTYSEQEFRQVLKGLDGAKLAKFIDLGRVPDMPMAKNWHELAFKRALRYAAENGYEAMTWTTGEQQADRFDLSKQVDSLLYEKNSDGTYRLSAQIPGRGGQMLGEKLSELDLEDNVGKEIARKIINGDGKRTQVQGKYDPVSMTGTMTTMTELRGLDLKVGGEGMKGFYDSILPAFANKYGRKWGVKVGEAKVAVGKLKPQAERAEMVTPDVLRQAAKLVADDQTIDGYNRKSYLQAFDKEIARVEGGAKPFFSFVEPDMAMGAYVAKVLDFNGSTTETVHSIPITDSMRESVMQGQALFRKEAAPSASDILSDTKIQFKSGKRGQAGTLYANERALQVLRAAHEEVFGERVEFDNVNLNAPAARQMATMLMREADDPSYDAATARKLREVSREFNFAWRAGKTVSIVKTGSGRKFGDIKVSRRHELFHDAQEGLTNSRGFLAKHKYGDRLIDGLQHYSFEDRTVEAAAFIAGGQAKDFGLTDEQGKEFLNDYFDDIVATNGADALRRFVSLAPKVQDALKEARQKYGVQRQTGKDSSGRTAERSSAGTGTTGSVAGSSAGVSGKVREQGQAESRSPRTREDVVDRDVFDLDIGHRKVTVYKNPTSSEYAEVNKKYRQEYPGSMSGEPKSRFTVDEDGNRYIWMSGDAIHSWLEPALSKHIGKSVSQANQMGADYKPSLVREQKQPRASFGSLANEPRGQVLAAGLNIQSLFNRKPKAPAAPAKPAPVPADWNQKRWVKKAMDKLVTRDMSKEDREKFYDFSTKKPERLALLQKYMPSQTDINALMAVIDKADKAAKAQDGGALYDAMTEASDILSKKPPKWGMKRIGYETANAVSLPRALMASADISAPLRQGAILSLPPTQWGKAAKATVRMFQAFSTSRFKEISKAINLHPDAADARKAGLFIGTDKSGLLNNKEEDFISNWADKVPIVKHSEQAYKTYLDSLRMDSFARYKKSIDKTKGLSAEQKENAYKAAADWINVATGRGSLGSHFESAMPILSKAMFAPRYTASRIQVLNPYTYGKNMRTAEGRAVLKNQMSDMVQYAGMVSLTLALASAAGATVGLDPDDPDFLKMRFGNVRYDFLAGLQQPMRLFWRLGKSLYGRATGEKVNSRQTTLDIASRFARSKAAPVPSFFVDYLTGKDFIGRDFEMRRAVIDRVTPLMWRDFYEAYEKEGFGKAAMVLPGAVGIGVQNYDEKVNILKQSPFSKAASEKGLKYESLRPKASEPAAVFNQRKQRVEGWMQTYGDKLLANPRYKALSEAEQKAAIELLRDRIGRQQNLRKPNLAGLEPGAVMLGVKRSAAGKAKRQSKYLYSQP